uniref:Cationic amino acid transporter C-terminal domain-containing protein n=1 Tax=Romanomermis culicivorax TaxID=13658 RepID=A0A915HR04_ROMCU
MLFVVIFDEVIVIFSVINLLVIVFTICYGLTLARPEYWTDPSFCLANMSCYQDFSGPKSHVLHSIVAQNCTATDAFLPYGMGGVLSGSAKVFFSYIGFESIASAGEETINPQWTIPWGTLIAMVIVTSAYILMSLTLTMMIPFCTIKSDSAFASAFKDRGVDWARHAVSVGALSGMTTVLFGSLFSTPRGVYAMAEDGLLCKCFGYIHPRTQTPIVGVLIFGVLSAVVALVFNLDMLADFVSIGTLMAYSIVACSVIVLRYEENAPQISEKPVEVDKHLQQRKMSTVAAGELKPKFAHVKKFTGSLTTGQVIVLMVICMTCLAAVMHFGQWSPISWWLPVLSASLIVAILLCLTFLAMHEQETTGLDFKVPWVPVLPAFSLLLNIVFMLHLDVVTWIRFAVWLLLGSGIYFAYGIWHSTEGKNLKIKKAAMDLKLESYSVAEHYISNSEIKEPHLRHPVSKDTNDNYVTNVVADP